MSSGSVCNSPHRYARPAEPMLGKMDAAVLREEVSESPAPVFRQDAEHIEGLRRLQRRQRDQLSLATAPVQTMRYFSLAIAEQVSAATAFLATSRAALFLLLAILWLLSLLIAVDRPQNSVVHEILAYGRYSSWWLCLGIASSIGFGSGLHTFVLYLGPHIARFALKASACGRTDLKAAPYDTIQWGLSDSWSAQPCERFGAPAYPFHSSEHGGYYGVPLEAILAAVWLEAVLWGVGTAVGELPPFMVARAARISGERARELEELQEGAGEATGQGGSGSPGSSAPSFLSRLRVWILSRGSRLGFLPIFFMAAIPNPLFDLAGVVCGHYLVPVWKFFCATLLGKLVKGPTQAAFVALLFSAHLIDSLESLAERLLLRLPLPLLSSRLPALLAALDAARRKLASGEAIPASSGVSLSAVWSAIVTLLSLSFLSSVISSTAKSYLVHRQQRELDSLIRQHRTALQAARGDGVENANNALNRDEDDVSSCVEDVST